MVKRLFTLELACYPRGQLALGVDEWLKASYRISEPAELGDGKLVEGSDLDGEHGATFGLESTLIELVDSSYSAICVHRSSVMRVLPYEAMRIAPLDLYRPCMLARPPVGYLL
jgi:hypothetical protein